MYDYFQMRIMYIEEITQIYMESFTIEILTLQLN